MVLYREKATAKRLQLARNQGFREPGFAHEQTGFDYRLTNLQAAIGVAQTAMIDEKVPGKRWIGRTYNELLDGGPDLTSLYKDLWAKDALLEKSFGVGKDALMKKLKSMVVETCSFFCPIHMQPLFKSSDPRLSDISEDYPVSTDLWNRGLYLPSGNELTRAETEEVA
jgi:perosamine synthetase